MESDGYDSNGRRVNGFSAPLGKRQVLTICVSLADLVIFFVFLAPLLQGALRWTLLGVFSVTWLIAAVTGITTMSLDPADPIIRHCETGTASSSEEESDTLYCRYCTSEVETDSKHCWECHKCVDGFDHHCPWLNTCIGHRNYEYFYACVSTFTIAMAVMIAASLILLVELFISADPLAIYGLGEGVILGVLILSLVVNTPFWALIVTLLAFHTYLCYRGITTYVYLTGRVSKTPSTRKQRQERQRRRRQRRPQDSTAPRVEDQAVDLGGDRAVGGRSPVQTYSPAVSNEVLGSLPFGTDAFGRQSAAVNGEDDTGEGESGDSAALTSSSSSEAGSSEERPPSRAGVGQDLVRRITSGLDVSAAHSVGRELSGFVFGNGLGTVSPPGHRRPSPHAASPGEASGAATPSFSV